MKKPHCSNCVHRRSIPWDAYFRCNNLGAKVKGNPYGIHNGWFAWPFSFDPGWLVSCDSFSDKIEDLHDLEPDVQLLALSMLYRRFHTVDKLKCETLFVGSNELRSFLQEDNKSFDWVEDNVVYKIAKGEITKVLWEEEEQETFQEGLTNVTKT